MRPTITSTVMAGLSLGLMLSLAATSALGQSRRGYDAPGYVVAESRWGNGTVSGPVRRGPVGRQVRLPGGTWVNCVRSCSETLRLQSIDFWKTVGREAPDGGPNYFTLHFGF